MKKTLLLIALTILSFVQINAQVVTIGTGTENDDGLPIDPYYGYSYSQCLYLASEINQTGNIYRIKYKGKTGISISNSNDWTIYMEHTTDSTLVSNSWIPTSAMTQVFTGIITVVNDNVEITLSTPFNYNGTDNLVIAIDENKSGLNGSSDDFLSTNVTGQRSLLYRNDNTNPDPANPPSTTIGQSAIANIDLDFNATACNAPTALSATNITTNSADISWTAGGTETSWQVEHGTVGFTLGAGTTVSSTSHTLSGLNSGTVYQYYVKADCGSGAISGWAGPFTFATTCVPYSIPYFEGFENAYTHEGDIGICFTQESIDGTPKWVGDDNTSNSSSLHAPRTGNWNALLYSGNKDWLFIPVQLTGGTSYTMELYARYSTSATPASTISINYGANANSSSMTNAIVSATTITNAGYQKLEGNFTPTTSGTYYVGIYGQALSFSFGYMTLDDISIIETPSCVKPSALSTSTIIANSANLNWTAGGSGGTSWQIEYGITGFAQGTGTTVVTSTNPHTLSGLTAETTYDWYIREICGAGDTSVWTVVQTFTTACDAITSFPFTEEFETITTGQPNCWGIAGTTTNTSYHWNSFGTGETGRGIRFNSYNNTSGKTSELTTPILDLSSLPTAQLSFYFKNPTGGNFEVLISTDGGTTYTSLENNLTGQASWLEKTYNITSHIGNNVKIQFKGTSNYGSGDAYVYLDGVEVKEVPSCVAPTSLTINNITATSIDLGWTAGGSGTSWQIEYDTTGFTQGTGTMAITSSNPHSLSGLSPETTYDWYVREICGAGDTSVWTSVNTFTTACSAIANFNENFDGTPTSTLPNCWSKIIDNGASSSAKVETYSYSNPHSGNRHIRMYNSNSSATSNIILVSPLLSNLNAGTHRLRFYAKNTNTAQDLEIGTVTNPTDGSTFTSLQSVDINGTYTEYIVNFNTYTGTNQYVAIRRLSTNNYSNVYLDNIIWEAIPSCVTPTSLTVSDIVATSANLAWTVGSSSGTSWQIEYDTTGFTQGTGTFAIATTNLDTLIGLTAETTYDWYIREICGAGDTSAWSSVNTFTTPCATITPDYTQTFNSFLPNTCWKQAKNGNLSTGPTTLGSSAWRSSNIFGNDVRINLYATNRKEWVLSPNFDLSAGGYEVLLDVAVTNYNQSIPDVMGSDDSVRLVYSTNGTTWNILKTWTATDNLSNTLTEFRVPVASTASNVQFALYATDGPIDDSEDYDFHFDNFIVRTTPSCLKPTALVVSNTTDTSANLAWTAGGSGGASWQIEYGTTGFTQGTGTFSIATTNLDTLIGLTANTSYDWYVREICGVGDTSAWTSANTFTTACATITDFNENFDALATYTLPDCWSKIMDNGTSSGAKVETYSYSNPHSGNRHIRMYNVSSPATSNIILVSPRVSNLSAGTHRLRFYAKNSNATQDLEVGTVSNPADGSTFTSLQSVDINDTYTEYTVSFNTYSGTDKYIAIRRLSTTNYTTVYLDNVVWEAIPPCYTNGTDIQTKCNSFTWINGVTYTASNNIAKDTIVGGASNGCDSIVTLDLTINQPSAKTIDYTGCEGDGYSIVVGSTTYNEANPTGTETLTNAVNCDSVVTINLTFNSVDNGVQVNNHTITANESNADTYAWINCDNNNTIIAGETSASYTPTETGNYAVIITKNNCVDTSVCSNVMITSINDVTTDGLKIYPNPSTGIITIETKSNSNVNLKVLSYNGKEVYREALTLSKEKVDLSELPKGLYFIVIEMKENTIMQKITIK